MGRVGVAKVHEEIESVVVLLEEPLEVGRHLRGPARRRPQEGPLRLVTPPARVLLGSDDSAFIKAFNKAFISVVAMFGIFLEHGAEEFGVEAEVVQEKLEVFFRCLEEVFVPGDEDAGVLRVEKEDGVVVDPAAEDQGTDRVCVRVALEERDHDVPSVAHEAQDARGRERRQYKAQSTDVRRRLDEPLRRIHLLSFSQNCEALVVPQRRRRREGPREEITSPFRRSSFAVTTRGEERHDVPEGIGLDGVLEGLVGRVDPQGRMPAEERDDGSRSRVAAADNERPAEGLALTAEGLVEASGVHPDPRRPAVGAALQRHARHPGARGPCAQETLYSDGSPRDELQCEPRAQEARDDEKKRLLH